MWSFINIPAEKRKHSDGHFDQEALDGVFKEKHVKPLPRYLDPVVEIEALNESGYVLEQPVSPNKGDLILVRWNSKRTCPAMVIEGHLIYKQPAKNGNVWVYWFGEHKVSEVAIWKTCPFTQCFKDYFQSSLREKSCMFHMALIEVLQICSNRARIWKHMDKLDLIDWAMNGFHVNGEAQFHIYKNPQEEDPIPDSVKFHLQKIHDDVRLDDASDVLLPENWPLRINTYQESKKLKLLKDNLVNIEDMCICCDNTRKVVDQHPFFKGGICNDCKESMMENMFLIGPDGANTFCTVCCNGGDLFVCESNGCNKAYCNGCILGLCNEHILENVESANPWTCFLCSEYDFATHGHLQGKLDWKTNVIKMFIQEGEQIPPLPDELNTRPIRVLSLFDGIATGLVVLKQLNMSIDAYYASEIDQEALLVSVINHEDIKHIGDVTKIDEKKLKEIGPIDLLLGGSPCNDLSIVNPARRGLEGGTGVLFYEYPRILNCLKTIFPDHHIFWLFENVHFLPKDIKKTISNELGCQPAVWNANMFTAQNRARCFWGNIPGLYSSPSPAYIIKNHEDLSEILCCNREATVKKVRTVTTTSHSLKQGSNNEIYPVKMGDVQSTLWITELERLFGFPSHYTDVANIPSSRRQKLLGKSWSVPVIQHLLQPIKNFFKNVDQDDKH